MFLLRIVSVKKVKKRSDAFSPQSAITTGIGVVAGERIARSALVFISFMHVCSCPRRRNSSHNALMRARSQ